jgi:hypothetical protein
VALDVPLVTYPQLEGQYQVEDLLKMLQVVLTLVVEV